MSDLTSVNLLARIQSGEKTAWTRLMKLYAPLIRFWCRQRGIAETDVDDVAQEVWLAVGPTLRTFHLRQGHSFRAWLRGVTHNKTLEWHRRRSNQPFAAEGGSAAGRRFEQLIDDIQPDSTASDEVAESKSLYRQALSQVQSEFEDRTWKAFLGVAIDGKSASEVGEILGLSCSAVRMAKCRVLRRIRVELGEFLD